MESDGAGPQHPPLVSEVCASKPDDAPVSAFLVLGVTGRKVHVGAEGSTSGPQPQKHPPSSSSDFFTFLFLTVLLYQDEKGCVLQSSPPLRRPSLLDAEQCA